MPIVSKLPCSLIPQSLIPYKVPNHRLTKTSFALKNNENIFTAEALFEIVDFRLKLVDERGEEGYCNVQDGRGMVVGGVAAVEVATVGVAAVEVMDIVDYEIRR